MKYYFSSLFLLFSICTFAQLPSTGLIAWYPFCGNAHDESGNGYHLTVGGATLTTDRFRSPNSAYYFSGSTAMGSNELYRNPPLPTDNTDFTYSAWFRVDTPSNAVIVANGNLNYDGYEIITVDSFTAGPGHDAGIVFGNVSEFLPVYVTFHQWHNAVLRRISNTYEFFVDTISVGTFTSSFYPTSTSEDFAIGQDYSNGTNPFTGAIDDVSVYNRALTNAEISQLYHYNPDAAVSLGNDTSFCSGSITVTASTQPSGTTYLWNTGSTAASITISTPGSYIVTVTNSIGCTASDTIQVQTGGLTVNAGTDSQICIGGTTSLHASGADKYKWSPSVGLSCDTCSDPTVILSTTTTYKLTGTDNGGCSGTDSVRVVVNPLPLITAQVAPGGTCGSGVIQLNATGGISYTWGPGQYFTDSTAPNPVINTAAITSPITCYVKGTDANGCSSIASVTVEPKQEVHVGFPSAFSPNGDGANDVLYVRGNGIATMEMSVFNRWGQKVFESHDPATGWDGTFNGASQPVDTYACILKIITTDGCAITQKGSVTLLK
ncbi:MAG: gliding motility-associated C-terminal domain-containing protein [Bacteroidetes bacterium]|nr:gliding motility-associated C-terminal domain-containing protein [Bacteroidota bacterium]